VHNAAKMLNASTAAGVSSGKNFLRFLVARDKLTVNQVVIFGDPNNGTAVAGISAEKTLVICHTGDNICQHGDQVLQPHLTVSPFAPSST